MQVQRFVVPVIDPERLLTLAGEPVAADDVAQPVGEVLRGRLGCVDGRADAMRSEVQAKVQSRDAAADDSDPGHASPALPRGYR